MSTARHPRAPELDGVSLQDIMDRYVGRYREKVPDWAAFEDAKIEGYKRAQHRFIGVGGSGKHDDPNAIPAGVIHGFENRSLEPVYFQVMLGRGRPVAMGYADDALFERRDAHLKDA